MPVPASFIPESKPKSFVPDPEPAPISKPSRAPVVTSPFQGLSANLPGDNRAEAATPEMTREVANAIWNPRQAASEIGQGVKQLASYRAGPGYRERAIGGANQLIEGAAEMGKPLALAAGVTAPGTTLAALGAGMAAQRGAEAGLQATGVEPETARLGGNIAGALPIIGGAQRIGRGLLDRFRPVDPLPSRTVAEPLPPAPVEQPPVVEARPIVSPRPEPMAAPVSPTVQPPKPRRARLTPEQRVERLRAENARLKTARVLPEKPAPQGKEVIPPAQPEVPPAERGPEQTMEVSASRPRGPFAHIPVPPPVADVRPYGPFNSFPELMNAVYSGYTKLKDGVALGAREQDAFENFLGKREPTLKEARDGIQYSVDTVADAVGPDAARGLNKLYMGGQGLEGKEFDALQGLAGQPIQAKAKNPLQPPTRRQRPALPAEPAITPEQIEIAAKKAEPQPNMMTTFRQVREQMGPDVPPEQFNQVVLQGAKDGRWSLVETSDPTHLPPEQQAALIPGGKRPDGSDRFFTGLALKGKDQPTPYRQETQRGSWSERARQPGAPPEDKYFNFDRINVSPEEKTALRNETLKVVKEQGLDPREVESHAAVKAAARSIAPELEAKVISPEAMGIQSRAVRFAMRQRVAQLNKEVLAEQAQLNAERTSLTADELKVRDQAIAGKEETLKTLLGEWIGVRSADGRNLSMHNMMADSTWDLGYWMERGRRAAKLPAGTHLPDELALPIRKAAAAGETAVATGDQVGAQAAKLALAKQVSKLEEDGWIEMGLSLWKAGLLTGLRTHFRNIGGTATHQGLMEASRLPASMTDIALSVAARTPGIRRLFTTGGDRTVAGMSWRGIQNAGREAALKAPREVMAIMRHGATPEQLAAADLPRELNFHKMGAASDVINMYVNNVFRTVAAEDRVAKLYALRRSVEAQAKVIALNEARAGVIQRKHVIRRAQELADSPTEAMSAQAIFDADYATFNNDNRLANFLMRGRGALSTPGKVVVDVTVPFKRTPANVASRLIEYTPPGAVWQVGRALLSAIKERGIGKVQQKAIADAVGHGMVGAAAILAGYNLAKNGLMTGIRSNAGDAAQRATDEATGRQEGSILIGGKWRKILAFAPVGNLLAIGATMYETSTAPMKDEAKRVDKMLAIGGKTVLDQPMSQGLREMIEIAENPGRESQQFASRMIGSAVPQMVADVGFAMDPTRRDSRTKEGFQKQAKTALQARVPGWRESLPQRRDVLGQPSSSISDWHGRLADPFLSQPAKEQSDPLLAEITKHRIKLPMTERRVGEQDEEYRLRQQARGVAIRRVGERLVTLPAYQSASPEKQRIVLEKQLRKGDDFIEKLANTPRYKLSSPAARIQMMQSVISKYQ